ncbi:MAG: prepilin-type N-terminal cleavage/methylation domain-containing protein, partial [Gammaproteobacteria bacterium]|nr:prepilin-type N-terminal cleavage/methylation domain-containing protein [Gammaproteobacteria bacterium]
MQRANKLPVSQRGFTLLELLIASIIFAIMAVMAYGGLANVLDNSKSSQLALKRLQQIQQSISVLNRDFS